MKNAKKEIALNAAAPAKSKLIMNLRQLFAALAALACAGSAMGQNENLTAIFTNTLKNTGVHRAIMPRRPSIVFIACHGLAPGDLSCYGQTNFQTPNLDRLAREGMRFTDYHAAGDDLALAQAALMTGTDGAFAAGETTLADRLHAAGYRTHLIGEWTLGPKPWQQGFDDFFGYLSEQDADNYYADFIYRYAPNQYQNPTNGTLQTFEGPEEIYYNTGGKKNVYIPDFLMNAAGNWMHDNAPIPANRFRPFFLLVNLPFPHTVTPGKDDYPVPTDAPFTGENWPQAAKNRAALVTRFDDDIGRLLERMKKLSLTNDVAMFLAGAVAPEAFADTNMNFLLLKNEVRDGAPNDRLRVPMIARWPEQIPAGAVSSVPWGPVDFGPTAMDIAHARPVSAFKGVSLLPTLLGETNSPAPQPHGN